MQDYYVHYNNVNSHNWECIIYHMQRTMNLKGVWLSNQLRWHATPLLLVAHIIIGGSGTINISIEKRA